MRRSPTELAANLAGINGIATIVARPICNRRDQTCMGSPIRKDLIEERANHFNNLLIGLLTRNVCWRLNTATTNAVTLSKGSAACG